MAEVASLKDSIQSGEDARRKADEALRNALLVMPNLPLEEVPVAGFERIDHSDDRAWVDWPSTRYEQKALREGRRPHYLTFRRL